MQSCTCYYYRTDSGRCQVEDFINSLSESSCRQYFSKVELLETFGQKLPTPHAKKIENKEKIYELRFNDIAGVVRIFYFFFDGNNAIFTNAFVKKKQKTPRKEIETAINRKNLFMLDKSKKKKVESGMSKLKKK